MKLLLIEDNATMQTTLRRTFERRGMQVLGCTDGERALALWQSSLPDAVLLDLSLPGRDGLDVLAQARAAGLRTPVIILTARGTVGDRILGLNTGADDYLAKPFDLDELEARLRALVRRSAGTDDVCDVGALRLDRKTRRLTLGGELLELPAREFEVLCELMTPPGRVVSKRALSDKLSDFDEALGDNALEAFISRLRKKLAGSGAQIRTLRGLGYALEVAGDRS